jgi:6-phosphogluconate dehydrogenase
MGGNIVRRLLLGGHTCVVYDADAATAARVAADGAAVAQSLAQLVEKIARPRAIWVMLPAGEITETTIAALAKLLAVDDVIIDGGNTFFHDDVRRAATLRANGIHYLDVGTSGGVWGLTRGYCLMIGGDRAVADRLAPVFATLAPGADGHNGDLSPADTAARGYLYCGPSGAGHFVKMIHNGIEYGMMQAFAEGFDILRGAGQPHISPERRYEFDLAAIAEVWRHGSVISSWLLDLTAEALAESPDLANFSGVVQDSGEGRWTVSTAVEEGVPASVITAALFARFRSQRPSFGDKVLSAMRHKFGGHAEPKS